MSEREPTPELVENISEAVEYRCPTCANDGSHVELDDIRYIVRQTLEAAVESGELVPWVIDKFAAGNELKAARAVAEVAKRFYDGSAFHVMDRLHAALDNYDAVLSANEQEPSE